VQEDKAMRERAVYYNLKRVVSQLVSGDVLPY